METYATRIKAFLCAIIKRYIQYCPTTPIGAILMLHRVDVPDPKGIWYNQHLKLSPSTIEDLVNYARNKRCKFVSMAELTDALVRRKSVRRLICITLDDGYRDNYTYGKLTFDRLNVPYLIYVCTRMVEGKMVYWWEIFEQLISKHDSISLSNGRTFDCSTAEAKQKSFMDIREIILTSPQSNLLNELKSLFSGYNIDWNYGNDFLGLTWDQIRELKKDKLCTIGNHTYSHNAFTGCSDEEIKQDIYMAAQAIYQNCGIEMHDFAFPFGESTAVSQHDIELVKSMNFKSSATTKNGLVQYGTDVLELPRLFVTEHNWKQVIDYIADNC